MDLNISLRANRQYIYTYIYFVLSPNVERSVSLLDDESDVGFEPNIYICIYIYIYIYVYIIILT